MTIILKDKDLNKRMKMQQLDVLLEPKICKTEETQNIIQLTDKIDKEYKK